MRTARSVQVQCLDESVADNVFFGVRSAKRGARAKDLDKKVWLGHQSDR